MMLRRTAAVAALMTMIGSPALAAPDDGDEERPRGGPDVIKVGAASRSVLPTVGGSHDYLAGVSPDPGDPFSPGLFVPEWDQGRVAVGNGHEESWWVHDDMEVTAVAFEEQRGKQITVVVAANLYMIFGADADAIRAEVADRLPAKVADRLDIAIHADHNHHGPDTAFDVNHEWYDLMIDQAANAVVEAIDERRPARLEVAETEHYFGLRDSRDARVHDPSLGVLRATATNGDTIATLVFWANHPETTLFWDPPTEPIADDCKALEQMGVEFDDGCTFEDSYFTADFPGWTARIIEEELGGEVAYFNGAIGGLITPLESQVWEVSDDFPLADGLTPPDGAPFPHGATSYTERNFRRAYLIGRELANAALGALETSEPIERPAIDYDVAPFYTHMSHIGFRTLLVRGPDGFASLGHTPGEMYECPPAGPKNDDTCTGDGFATVDDPIVGTHREGDHVRTQAAYLRIGPVGTMWLPAEVLPESTIGLPAGYHDTPEQWHGDDPAFHALGEDYETSGSAKNRMDDEYRWVVGLGNDELGYAVPLSDYRISCVAGVACADLHAAGLIEHPDAVAGATCKHLYEGGSLPGSYPPEAVKAISASCTYGQVFGEADDHYEETNSAGWDLEADILAAVAELTGNDDPATINPDFPGWWSGLTP